MKKFKSKVLNSQEQSSFNTLTDKEKLIFLAGVFEGEGSFGFWGKVEQKRKYLRAQVQMTDKDIILRFYDYFKLGYIGKNRLRFNDKKSFKQTWTWKVSGEKAVETMLKLYPYLGIRRKEKFDQCYKC